MTSFTDDKGKFAGNKGTSDILDSCAAMLVVEADDKICVPAATQQTSLQSIGENDANVNAMRNEAPVLRVKIFMKLRQNYCHAFIAASLCVASFSAHSASINCEYAKTKVERLICGDLQLLRLDSQLNLVFSKAQNETAGVDGETGARSDPVGKEEKEWVIKVRNKCSNISCLKSAYQNRIEQIHANWNVDQ